MGAPRRASRLCQAQQLFVVGTLLILAQTPLRAAPVNATLGVDPGTLAGTGPDGRLMLYTPDPLEGGSSISHWDTSAFGNLLMEPSINSDLGFAQTDLTTFQLRDVGWPSGTSTVTLRVGDPVAQGFNDPNLGARRLTAVEHAAGVWGSLLESSVEINIAVEFQSLECGDDGAVLAQAGAEFLFESFAGAPFSGTWYHGALAESLSGQNLSLENSTNPDAADVAVTFNSEIDNGCLGGGSRFYYGLDDNVPSGQISFVNVALHEMAHGLGFSTFTNTATGVFFMMKPDIYSRFIFDNSQGQTWHQLDRSGRQASATNTGQVTWSGNRVTSRLGNFLDPAPVLEIHSPSSIAGIYRIGAAEFGPPLTRPGVTGDLVLAVDGTAKPSLLCEAAANASEIAGKIAVVDRGDCLFTIKVKNAQNAGAIGVIVVNNIAGSPPAMGGSDASIVIPSVSIRMDDGERIKTALEGTAEPGILRFTAASYVADEGGGATTISVRRGAGNDGAVTVDYATGSGSATAGEDYLPASGTFAFADGQGGTMSFSVDILDDEVTEGEETVELILSNPTGGATLGNLATASLSIADDDLNPAGFLSFSSAALRVNEGDGRVAIEVERTGGAAGAVTVDYASGGGSASPGADYVGVAGNLAFADGESGVKTFEVEIVDDGEEEPGETFGLALSAPTGGALLGAPSSTLVEIVDNEACVANDNRLCLNQGRFRVEVSWRDFDDLEGPGTVVVNSDDSGLFWFFSEDNWEMLVKVLDGCSINNHFWVFAAATTNVEYTLTVTDTLTGDTQDYLNRSGVAAPAITDTEAFDTCTAGGGSGNGPAAPRRRVPAVSPSLGGKAECQADATHLCLNQGRFQVQVAWRDFSGGEGPGKKVVTSDDSGLFWFFGKDNWEMLVKVLDGCGINNHYWVFSAATTNVEYTLTVTDTVTGDVRSYKNQAGVAASATTDTGAFEACP